MWLLANHLPIRLEALDQTGQVLTSVSARLESLNEDAAQIVLDPDAPPSCFHWGSPIRFNLEDGLRRYEITGAITARQRRSYSEPEAMGAREDTGSAAEAAGDAGDAAAPLAACPESPPVEVWELRIRVWEYRTLVQRRTMPRRRLRFPVLCSPLAEEGAAVEGGQEQEVSAPPVWCGSCTDIGGGGIRVRIPRLEAVPERMSLQFRLPISGGVQGRPRTHEFCLAGRVLRADVCGRHNIHTEIVLNFEHLSVADGLVLKTLLS